MTIVSYFFYVKEQDERETTRCMTELQLFVNDVSSIFPESDI